MSMIEEKAQQVMEGLAQGRASAPLPAHLDVGGIVGIIITLLQMYLNCNKTAAQAQKQMKRAGPIQRTRVNMIVKDRLGKPNKALAASVLTVGGGCTVPEVTEMMQEAQAGGA